MNIPSARNQQMSKILGGGGGGGGQTWAEEGAGRGVGGGELTCKFRLLRGIPSVLFQAFFQRHIFSVLIQKVDRYCECRNKGPLC